MHQGRCRGCLSRVTVAVVAYYEEAIVAMLGCGVAVEWMWDWISVGGVASKGQLEIWSVHIESWRFGVR